MLVHNTTEQDAITKWVEEYKDDKSKPPVVYFDVDDTLITYGSYSDRPKPTTLGILYRLHNLGCKIYIWSHGGALHAEQVAKDLGISSICQAFLDKPHIYVDDMLFENFVDMLIKPLSGESSNEGYVN